MTGAVHHPIFARLYPAMCAAMDRGGLAERRRELLAGLAGTVVEVGAGDGGKGAYYRVEDCVLDPGPVRPGGPPLMLGSTGPRMMRIALPHVDSWNVWWSRYGNTPEGSPRCAIASRKRPRRPDAHRARSPPPRR